MVRGLKNTTASADSACRWGTYTVMYSFFSSTCQITEEMSQRERHTNVLEKFQSGPLSQLQRLTGHSDVWRVIQWVKAS